MAKSDLTDPLQNQVPAKEFARKIGQYQREALVRPVTITTHGQPSLVVLSVTEYQRLKRRDRQVLDLDKLSVDEIDELLAALAAQRPQDNSDEHDHELDGWKP